MSNLPGVRGPDHAPGSSLDYLLDFSKKVLAPGESIVNVEHDEENVSVQILSSNRGKIVFQVTAEADTPLETTAEIVFTVTTDSTPPRVFVQTVVMQIRRIYAVLDASAVRSSHRRCE